MKSAATKSILMLTSLAIPAGADLVGDWNLEEGTGPAIEQISLTASDPLRPGVTWSTDTPGPASTASLQFDGSNSGNYATSARLGLNRNASNLGIQGTGAKTIIAWIKTTQTDKRYFWGWSPGNGLIPGGDLRLGIENSGKLRFEISNGFTRFDGISLNDGDWHMVAVVIDAGDTIASVDFYIDGNLHTPTANSSQLIDTVASSTGGDATPNECFFASGANSATQLWIGGIDGFQIHNTALSETELDAIRDAMAVAPPPTLVWNNASGDGLWNTTSANWNNGTTDLPFTDGDKVRFQDLPGTFETVEVTGTRTPESLNIDTFATDYEFTGTGTIGGSGPIQVNGGGFAEFTNTGGIATTGALTVSSGSRVLLGTTGNQGSTAIEALSTLELLEGASVSGPIANAGSIVDSSTIGTATLSGVISGGGSLLKAGASTLVAGAVNTFTGNTVVDSGVLEVPPGGGLYHGGYRNTSFLTVNEGATVRVAIFTYNALGAGLGDLGGLPDYSVHRQLFGGTLEVTGNTHSSGNGFRVGPEGGTFRYTAAGQTLTLSGNANDNIRISGPLTFDTVGNITVSEVIQDGTAPGGIVKTGAGTLTFSGTNTYTGATTINSGTLSVNGASLADTASLVIAGGKVASSGIETVGTLFFGTEQQSAGTWGATDSGAQHIDDSRFSGIAGVINVTTGPGLNYTTWAAANTGGDGPGIDSDGDGVPNAVEFLMGETGSGFTSNPALVSGAVTWPKNPMALATWVVETSTNLRDELIPGDGGWTAANAGVTDDGDSIEFTPPAGSPEKLFIRLRVTVSP